MGVREAGGAQKRLVTRDDVWGDSFDLGDQKIDLEVFEAVGIKRQGRIMCFGCGIFPPASSTHVGRRELLRVWGAGSSLGEPLARAGLQSLSGSFSRIPSLAPHHNPGVGGEPMRAHLTKSFLLGTIPNIYRVNRSV